jgi:HK97 family phage major capsid protein
MSEEKTTTPDAVDVQKVVDLAQASVDNADAARKAVEELTGKVDQVQSDLARQEEIAGQKFTEMRQYLETKHGKSGAEDYFNLFGKWICGMNAVHRGLPVPDDCKAAGLDFEKATITTGTSGTAYLVPSLLSPAMFESKNLYGSIISRMQRYTVAAGQQMAFNADATDPVAGWQAQGAAIAETTGTWSQSTVTPKLVGSWVDAGNELLAVPGVGYGEKIAQRMLKAIVKAEETGILQGDDDGDDDGTDPPSDGILTSTSGCTDKTNIAASTIAAYVNFIADCIDTYEGLIDNGEATLILTPAKAMALAAQTVHATNLPGALTWADPRTGLPGQLMGYEWVAHPGAKVSTTHYAILAELGEQVYANSGKLAVDFNPWGAGFKSNTTTIRVITHSDWCFPKAANICFADYT